MIYNLHVLLFINQPSDFVLYRQSQGVVIF